MYSKLRDFAGCALALGTGPSSSASILWRQTKNVRARLRLSRFHPDETFSIDTIYGRLHFRDNFGDVTNLTNLLYRRIYELPYAPEPGHILDVGANIGLAAVWFSSRYPGSIVHGFEPLVENAAIARMNAPTARINAVAVGSAPGEIMLAVDADSVMASSIAYSRAVAIRPVTVVTLDDYVRSEAIERVSVLKIDAEGMELDILAGAAATLGRVAQVVIETHGEERHVATLDLLKRSGFTIPREVRGDRTGMVFAARGSEENPADRGRLRDGG